MTIKESTQRPPGQQQFWWSNAIVFVGTHIAACAGVYYQPLSSTPKATLVLSVVLWQAACLGITIGYHRLYSHRSFEAGVKTRALLALLGSSAAQGSIKVRCPVMRHRLHHACRYSATRGLLWSHMGWIFYKQRYERMSLVDKDDLDEDLVSTALFTAILVPTIIGSFWHDAIGAFIWAGLVSRLVGRLAHWDGLQPYSDENTSRLNLIVALLTCGEGNHNFHSFPQDFRAGPSAYDWDPSKWVILALHRLGLVKGLRKARDKDLSHARWRMHVKTQVATPDVLIAPNSSESQTAPMSISDVCVYVERAEGRCILLIDDMVIDATAYTIDHPGGAALLRKYAIKPEVILEDNLEDHIKELRQNATAAFHGGMNKHTLAARDRLRELAIARLVGH
ncbi:uncharacterized protein PHACADRAFT_156838 [Phanerochaete carnosa HHB-10118-sp]|uniref:Stearoyl-CoA 9-desaturase n=1 Tax=Phanerochaete carnosa (strain HHB-10118-sp) TaxID=650164 RepID=K5WCA1_PHACS|nr:uncharacterized protein PHACADRAFT_156838 [Phanerochaete carnosa HHB-10118-sp]EKM61593.1 hypothetical protein PHACADRAFT_156838 [Phanerochaete carnosa HHB-10118-sp]